MLHRGQLISHLFPPRIEEEDDDYHDDDAVMMVAVACLMLTSMERLANKMEVRLRNEGSVLSSSNLTGICDKTSPPPSARQPADVPRHTALPPNKSDKSSHWQIGPKMPPDILSPLFGQTSPSHYHTSTV